MEKFEVWISSGFAPAFFSAAMTAATLRLFSLTASSTVGEIVWTETLNEKRSGVVMTRAVPVTLTVSTGAGSRGGAVCANAVMETAKLIAKIRNRFIVKTS